MKKSKLLLVLACGMLLAACGDEKPAETSSSSTETTSMLPPAKEGSDVFDQSVIDANIVEPVEVEPNEATSFRANSKITIDDDIVESYLSAGLLVRKNAAGLIGFYSLLHNDYLIAPQFEPAWLSYSVTTLSSGRIPYLIRIQYENFHYLVDAFGNKLVDKAEESAPNPTFNIINEKLYATVGSGLDRVYFEYNEKGKATKIAALPDFEYEGPEIGDTFAGSRMDLADYGKEGYELLVTSKKTYVLFKDGAFVRASNLESGENLIAAFGTKLLLQRTYRLANDATEYDYIVPSEAFYRINENDDNGTGTKYRMETSYLDLETGVRTNVKTRFLFNGAGTPVKDAEGIVKYMAVSYYNIPDDRILEGRYLTTRLLDEQLVQHDKVNDLLGINLLKLDDDHFYSATTRILFDGSGKPITDLSGLGSAQHVPLAKGFMGTYGGKLGFVGYDGKVKAEFKYDQLFANEVLGTKVLAVRNNRIYRLDLSQGTEALVADNYARYDKNIFVSETADNYVIFNASGEIGRIAKLNLTNINFAPITYLSNESGLAISADYYDKDLDENTRQFRFVGYGNASFASSSVGKIADGLEHQDGSSFEEREATVLGDNKVHANRYGSYVYTQFTADKDGDYSFLVPQGYTLSGVYHIAYDELTGDYIADSVSYTNISSTLKDGTDFTSAYRVYLEAEDEDSGVSGDYLVRYVSSYTWTEHQVSNVRIEYNVGYYASTPLEISPDDTSVTFTPSKYFFEPSTIRARLIYEGTPGRLGLELDGAKAPVEDDPTAETPLDLADDSKSFALTEYIGSRNVMLYFTDAIETEIKLNVSFEAETLKNNTKATAKSIAYGSTNVLLGTYEEVSDRMYAKFAPVAAGVYAFNVVGRYGENEDDLTHSYSVSSTYQVLNADGTVFTTGGNYYGGNVRIPEGGCVILSHSLYTGTYGDDDENYYLSQVTVGVSGVSTNSVENPTSSSIYSQWVYSSNAPRYYRVDTSRRQTFTFAEDSIALTYYRMDADNNVISSTSLRSGENYLDVHDGVDHGVLRVECVSGVSSSYLTVGSYTALTYGVNNIRSLASNDGSVLFAYVYNEAKTQATFNRIYFTNGVGGFNISGVTAPYGFFVVECVEGTGTPSWTETGTGAGRIVYKTDAILFETDEETDEMIKTYNLGEFKAYDPSDPFDPAA